MTTFTLGGRAYDIAQLRLGELKQIAKITSEPFPDDAAAMFDRHARIVAVVTARWPDGFRADDDDECEVAELLAACDAVLKLGGFVSAAGEAKPAAAGATPSIN